jgi:hypothetical protein
VSTLRFHDVASLNFAFLDDASLERRVPRTLHPQNDASHGCCVPSGMDYPSLHFFFVCSHRPIFLVQGRNVLRTIDENDVLPSGFGFAIFKEYFRMCSKI